MSISKFIDSQIRKPYNPKNSNRLVDCLSMPSTSAVLQAVDLNSKSYDFLVLGPIWNLDGGISFGDRYDIQLDWFLCKRQSWWKTT